MTRKSLFGRLADSITESHAARHHDHFRAHIEPLEIRSLMTASPVINEIYFDPPGSPDNPYEYIELRGEPSAALTNTYLIFLENENSGVDPTINSGTVERIFNLNAESFGTNGFLTLRQKASAFTTIAPGTTDLINTGSGQGWGSGATSSLNTVGEPDPANPGEDKVVIENSGFTAMLIVNNGGAPSAPTIGMDLDVDNNGLDVPNIGDGHWGNANWTVLDSIGVFSENGEAATGRLYAPINFGPGATTNIEPGATYVNGTYEIEYIGRYGNSTGSTAADWLASNLTNKAVAGFVGPTDFRQSNSIDTAVGDPMDENNHGIPYGTIITNTLGAPNFPGVSTIPTGGRQLFYNQSTWDGGVDSITTSDDAAIATDKTAYIAGSGSASSTALSSFNRGINGVMVDLLGGGSHTAINASDFIFKTGNDNTPSGWATASAPVLITVRTGAGVSSSDRVEILWGANAVKKAWLEVEVLNTAHTGLAATDVFYWGNMVGDSNLNFATSGADSSNVLANPTGAASISNTRDHNRSKVVNGTDSSLALANVANIVRINLSAGSMSPVGGGDGGGIGAGPAASSAGDSGIASGLSATAATASSPVHVPAWVLDRLRKLDLNSGPVADYFQYLHDQGTPQAKAILTKADRIADALHLDDHFLDSLLDDLGLE